MKRPEIALVPGAAARAARITAYVKKLDWGKLSKRLERYAFVCMGRRSPEAAADAAQSAITQVLDPNYMEWDPNSSQDFFAHLAYVVRGVISSRRQLRSTTGEIATDHDDLAQMATSRDKTPEEALSDMELVAALNARLVEAFADDPLVTKLVALIADDVATPREQAAATGASYDEVKNARRRLFYAANDMARELGIKSEVDDGR
jgi:hypothetical protein